MKNGLPYRFPPPHSFETTEILKELVHAHRYLAELKGVAKTMPNAEIVIAAIAMQEAESSSAIENIVTTQDALYKYAIQPESQDSATKEAADYASALHAGFERVGRDGSLTLRTIVEVQAILEGNDAGFRVLPGTVLKDLKSGEIVYTPPPPELVPGLMGDLERYINAEDETDPIIRMALIHHLFESIHPFYDGNGRTGRIINILYLVTEGLLDTPILYLSRYFNQTRSEYYRLLREVRDAEGWEEWVVYIVRGVAATARQTIGLIGSIRALYDAHRSRIRERHKFYSLDLMNSLFRHPYTKTSFLAADLGVNRVTAMRYLDVLAADDIVEKRKLGKENYYINRDLVALLFTLPELDV